MNSIFNKNTFLIKEHLGIFKAANNYDIFDATNNQMIMKCTEPNLGFFTKMFRFTDYKRMTPFDVQITTTEGKPLLSIKRGISIFRSDVEVLDDKNQLIGSFKQQFWSIGGKFELLCRFVQFFQPRPKDVRKDHHRKKPTMPIPWGQRPLA